ATSVVVRVNNGGLGNDTVTVFNSANTTQLPLGSVNLARIDYTTANITFGATGTASTMTQSRNSITVKLGTQSAAGTTALGTGTMIWTPSATATDRAGNAESTANVTETGAADKDFSGRLRARAACASCRGRRPGASRGGRRRVRGATGARGRRPGPARGRGRRPSDRRAGRSRRSPGPSRPRSAPAGRTARRRGRSRGALAYRGIRPRSSRRAGRASRR